jgi:hypothetical protein
VQPDDLYGLPMDRFVAERAALAKQLREAGRRDEAAEVAKLRKPSVAAWAVNQLMRTQSAAAAELFAAGDAVRVAQADVLAARGDARTLRDAGERERDAVAGLVETARGLLSADGSDLSESTRERVADTLHAAALDDAAREQVRAGRLERELRHAGLGLGDGATGALVAAPAKAPAVGAGKQRSAADREAGRRAVEERAAAAATREKARRQARAAVAKAAKREERAGHALRAAEERRDRAAAALAGAEEALDQAQAEAVEATDEHRRARAALDGA